MSDIKALTSQRDVSIKSAWKKMGDNGYRALFIVDDDGCLLGSVADGDVRRWILQDNSILDRVDKLMNPEPICFSKIEGLNKELVEQRFIQYRVECIPVINEKRQIEKVIFWDDLFKNGEATVVDKIDVPVVIMAGGKGERLAPFTKIIPKPLFPIGEKPIVELIMDKFAAYGVKDFFLTLGYKASMIKAYFADLNHPYNIKFVQEDRPLGTAGALALLKDDLKSTFILSNADILVDANYSDILRYHRDSKSRITLVCSMKHFPIPYGVVQIENGGNLRKIEEKPEFDHLVLTGIYVVEAELLRSIPEGQSFHMTRLIEKLMAENEKIGVYPVSDKMWMDVGEFKEYQETLKRFE